MPSGGRRKNAGRKPKKEEDEILEKLNPLLPHAFEAMEEGLKNKVPFYVKMWFEYYYGKPRQKIDHTTGGENINIPIIEWVK